MGIGLFQRTRKLSKSMSPATTRTDSVHLRVLVDSGPNAREVFVVRVNGEDKVDAIRTAIAAQIGHHSMSLFKVSPLPAPTQVPSTPVDPEMSPTLRPSYHRISN